MARLNDFLARWLLRRLKRKPGGDPLAALTAHLESQTKLIERHRESAEKREQVNQKRRKRQQQLKAELRQMKEKARANQHESWKWETECRVLREKMNESEETLANALERPGMPFTPLRPNGSEGPLLRRIRRTVWNHPMRLGVLRQHEPRPLIREHFPETVPPGPESAWPSVSIVTPSFQQAEFIGRTMRSVLEQHYPKLDYRVCDGGSLDGSVEIIRERAHELAGWFSESDVGPASAINKGFAQSTGEIMAYLNSDDVLLPGAVNFVANYFARHPKVDAIYGHRIVIDERDREVGRWVLPRHEPGMLLWADYIPQETLFWRRRVWERTGARLDESLTFAFDWDLLLRFQKIRARIVRLPWFLAGFRMHDAQKSMAEIDTTGQKEMAHLRERELGALFNKERLARKVVMFQMRSIWFDRLLHWGIRW